jgi:putative flippase GtrA
MNGLTRWLKFNAVGFGGILLQLAVLTLFTGGFSLNYVLGTALGVEAAIIHNYLWHRRYTWADRSQTRSAMRFLKFNLTTGGLSIGGNLVGMGFLVGKLHLHFLVGNCISIALCSIANFLVSDRVVFEGKTPYTAAGAASTPSALKTCRAASRPERMQSGTPIPR